MNFADLDVCVRSFRNELIEFTSELVAIASENPPQRVSGLRASHRVPGACARPAVRSRAVSPGQRHA
jgi:hypothetical protein